MDDAHAAYAVLAAFHQKRNEQLARLSDGETVQVELAFDAAAASQLA
jgi:hypothetical protein